MIMRYLENMRNNHKALIRDSNSVIIEDDFSGEWKIELTMQINFFSSLDSGKNRIMDSKNDKVEIIMGIERDNIVRELFESFLKNYHKNL